MRNLKRVLSLTLATAMLFGMMVMGAAAANDKKTAADLTDSDKVTNKEAVTLLVDLGVIEGKSDGSYSPAETVNRATMAKLITMMMLGDVDQGSFKGTTTDLTDINNHWAEGYIKYCYANNIISGDGAGHFFPDQEVTVVQAAKMLLVAVGYDSDDRGYTGSSWSINTMRDAQSTTQWEIGAPSAAGATRALTKGLSIKSTDPLSRDAAAQMIFNTLFVTNKKPVFGWDMGKQFISSYSDQSSLAATTYDSLTRHVGVLDSVTVATGFANIGGTPVKISAETANIGSTVVYYKAGSPSYQVSTEAVPTTAEVLATNTNGTAFTNLLTRGQTGFLGLTLDENVSIYVNGTKATTDTNAAGDNTAGDGIYYTPDTTPTTGDYDKLLAVGGAKDATGDIIDFIDADSNGKVDTIKITEYTLSVITKTTAEKTDGTEATISIKGVSGTIDQSLVVGDFAALAKDDVVLYAKIGDMFYVSEPETFEGSVSRFNSAKGTVVIGGTTYSVAGTPNVSGMTTASAYSFGTGECVFYMDINGYIVAFDGVSTVTKHAVVDAIAYVGGTGANPSGYFEAKLIFADGTVETVRVNKIAGNTLLATNGTTTATAGTGVYSTTLGSVVISTTASANASAFANAVYTYKVDSKDNYDLTRVDTAHTGTKVEKGNANVAGQATANNDTVYVYKTTAVGKADVITVYTGYKNAPTTSTSVNVSVATKGGYATFVFVTDAATNVGDSTTDVIVFLALEGVENNADGTQTFLYKASVNGEVDTYKATSDQTTETNYALNTPLDVTIDSDGYISGTGASGAFVAATGYITGNATANASNGTLKTNATIAAASPLPSISNAAFSFDGSETVYFVGGKDVVEGSASDIQNGMFFYVKTVDTTTVAGRIAMKTVYVLTPDDATPSTQGAITATTLTSGTLDGGNATLTASVGGTIQIQVANTVGKYTSVTISGAGTTVSNASSTASAADATYTLVAGDTAGKVLTVTVMTSEPGKGITSNVYSIALA